MSASGAYLEGGETEVSGEAFMSTSNVVKPLGGPGSAPDPAGGGLRLAAPSPRPYPRTPLGELTALPRPPSWWGWGWLPPPQEPYPLSRSRPFGPRTTWPSATRVTPPKLKS